MPPKQSKADIAKKQKVVEDKTFGLKNKNKSKNVQKYVQSLKQSGQPKPDPSKLQAQVKLALVFFFVFPNLRLLVSLQVVCANRNCSRPEFSFSGSFLFFIFWEKVQKKKEEEKAREKELQELFKVAVKQPKVPVGELFSDILSIDVERY